VSAAFVITRHIFEQLACHPHCFTMDCIQPGTE